MNRNRNFVLAVICLGILMLLQPQPAVAQVAGGGGSIAGIRTGPVDPSKPKVEINREPIPTMDLKIDLVEILPSGVNTIGTILSHTGYRVGGNGAGYTTLPGNIRVQWKLRLLQLDKNGITIDVTLSDAANATLLSQTLHLMQYEDAVVEVASAAANSKRLAIRFQPAISAIPAVQDYPTLVQRLTLSGLLILNSKEVVSRSSVSGSVEDLYGTKQQFFTIGSRSGLLVLSYRPFPGASLAGYFDDKKLSFEWNGDLYEWLSLDKPFMPEGKWSAYIWQADTVPNAFVSIGAFQADPNSTEFASILARMQESRKKMQTAKH